MATKRPTPPPKCPSAPARTAPSRGTLLPLALLGCIFPLVATVLDILGQGLPFSLDSVITVQQTQLLHYSLFYLVPLAMLLLPPKQKGAVRTPPAPRQPSVQELIASPTVTPPAQSQKAISTLQAELASVKTQLDQTRSRENTLSTLLDNAKDAILTLNVDGTIASANHGAEEMLGWTRQEMLGHPLNNLLALPSVPRLEEHLTHILSTPMAPAMIDLEFVHSDGTGLWAEGCSSVLRDAANQPTGLLIIYRTLKHRQEPPVSHAVEPSPARESQQQYSQRQIDEQPQAALSSAHEVSQSEALPIPGFLPDIASVAAPLAASAAASAFASPLEDPDLQGQEQPAPPPQFSFLDTQAAPPADAVPPATSIPLFRDEQFDADSQEDVSAPDQFTFADDQAAPHVDATPPAASISLFRDEQFDADSQEDVSAPAQFTFVDTQEPRDSQLSPPTPTRVALANQPQPPMLAPSTSPFNFSEALLNIGGDENLLSELATIFLEEYPQILANVRTAVANKDGEALVYHAHALKGSVGNFVAVDTQNAARKLEQMGREGNLANAPAILGELETALARLTPALSDLAVQGAA